MAGLSGDAGGYSFDTSIVPGAQRGLFQPGSADKVWVTDPFGGVTQRGGGSKGQLGNIGRLENAQISAVNQQNDLRKQLVEGLLGRGSGSGDISQPGFREGGGGTLMDSLIGGEYGEGRRARLESEFDTLQNNALGRLEARGLGGSSLVANALAGFGKEKSLAVGELEDQLFEQAFRLRESSLNRSTQLLAGLLGRIV